MAEFFRHRYISIKNGEGKVLFEETYKDGMRHGHKRLYFNGAKLCEEYHYNLGDLDGPYVIYYTDGKVFRKRDL